MTSFRPMLNKVPEVTVAFWIVKMMSTTVGETAADFLIFDAGLGLVFTCLAMAAALCFLLAWQLGRRRYVPSAYWLTVVMISIVGTLVSDYLVDEVGVSLVSATALFSVALAAVFAAWYATERTLSIHTVVTTRRELFYWTAILVTFALGTAGGDLAAEGLELGYGASAVGFGVLIAAVYAAYRFGLDPVLSFWTAYVLTRPFGASTGDLLSQPVESGGIGLGATATSATFIAVIAGLVIYFSFAGDQSTVEPGSPRN